MGEHRDRHAPGALARDAPIRPALDHRLDPVTALRRDPAGLGDRRQRLLPQTVLLHADEPLRRVAKDQRRLRSPGMRVGMHQRAARQEPAGIVDRGDHRLVRVARLAVRAIDRAAGEERHRRADKPHPERPCPAPPDRSPGRARNRRRRVRGRCARGRSPGRPRQNRQPAAGHRNRSPARATDALPSSRRGLAGKRSMTE